MWRCGGHQEQTGGATGGADGRNRLARYATSEIVQSAARLLLDGHGAVSMVVDDQ
jgi:hypothetical protein